MGCQLLALRDLSGTRAREMWTGATDAAAALALPADEFPAKFGDYNGVSFFCLFDTYVYTSLTKPSADKKVQVPTLVPTLVPTHVPTHVPTLVP